MLVVQTTRERFVVNVAEPFIAKEDGTIYIAGKKQEDATDYNSAMRKGRIDVFVLPKVL